MGSLVWGLFHSVVWLWVQGSFIQFGSESGGLLFTSVIWHWSNVWVRFWRLPLRSWVWLQDPSPEWYSGFVGPVVNLCHLVFCTLGLGFVFDSRARLISRPLGLLPGPGPTVRSLLWCPGSRVQSCIWCLESGCNIQCLSNNGHWL